MDFLPFLVGADGWMDGWVGYANNKSLALPISGSTRRSVFFFF